ncbi:3'-5' exonuclease [Hominifimenecus sp. rT4P-3]|uniref:3'-5' exonuclease n=1 Tax=Hominifimenecus sp. rT4P-3 TaxID=3242979 RepID=UPI003DA1E986
MLRSYVAFDIETTGLSPAENEVIEIGALKVREGKVCERFIEFIKPRFSIPASITRLTGISNEMVDSARSREQVIPDFLQFCGEDVLIGHNILFDYSFIKKNAENLGHSFEKQGIDTLKIARVVHKDLPSRSLGVLCEYYQIKNPAAHRAYHDALATAKLYQTLAHYYEEREPQIFQPSVLVARSQKSLPATQKQRKLLERLAKERGREQTWEMEQLTRAEASRLIGAFLSGENL